MPDCRDLGWKVGWQFEPSVSTFEQEITWERAPFEPGDKWYIWRYNGEGDKKIAEKHGVQIHKANSQWPLYKS